MIDRLRSQAQTLTLSTNHSNLRSRNRSISDGSAIRRLKLEALFHETRLSALPVVETPRREDRSVRQPSASAKSPRSAISRIWRRALLSFRALEPGLPPRRERPHIGRSTTTSSTPATGIRARDRGFRGRLRGLRARRSRRRTGAARASRRCRSAGRAAPGRSITGAPRPGGSACGHRCARPAACCRRAGRASCRSAGRPA